MKTDDAGAYTHARDAGAQYTFYTELRHSLL